MCLSVIQSARDKSPVVSYLRKQIFPASDLANRSVISVATLHPPKKPLYISLISHAVFDHDVNTLQQYDIPQRVTTHRDDVGVFSFADRAVIPLDLHRDGGPVSGRADRQHRIDSQYVHPRVELAPG